MEPTVIFYELSAIISNQDNSFLGASYFNCLLLLSCLFLLGMPPALASINDDHFDGQHFCSLWRQWFFGTAQGDAGKIVGRDRPTLLVFYVDDSSDCKQYAPVVSRLQAFYGRATDFIIINVDHPTQINLHTK